MWYCNAECTIKVLILNQDEDLKKPLTAPKSTDKDGDITNGSPRAIPRKEVYYYTFVLNL